MKVKLLTLAGMLLIGLSIFFTTRSTSQSLSPKYIVKLYAGNKVVATWESIGPGQIDGQTLTFSTGSTIYPHQVRICGTYSIEEKE
jgi:hypothetical protein